MLYIFVSGCFKLLLSRVLTRFITVVFSWSLTAAPARRLNYNRYIPDYKETRDYFSIFAT